MFKIVNRSISKQNKLTNQKINKPKKTWIKKGLETYANTWEGKHAIEA